MVGDPDNPIGQGEAGQAQRLAQQRLFQWIRREQRFIRIVDMDDPSAKFDPKRSKQVKATDQIVMAMDNFVAAMLKLATKGSQEFGFPRKRYWRANDLRACGQRGCLECT